MTEIDFGPGTVDENGVVRFEFYYDDNPPIVDFIVSYEGLDGKYYATKMFEREEGLEQELQLSSDVIGLAIENPQDMRAMAAGDANAKYTLVSNIDLKDGGPVWTGASDFSGTFFGNKYTINYHLEQTEGDAGLFNSLDGGATLESFNVVVSTPAEGLKLTGGSATGSYHFGGVVGLAR
jgi:hypothetical protein